MRRKARGGIGGRRKIINLGMISLILMRMRDIEAEIKRTLKTLISAVHV